MDGIEKMGEMQNRAKLASGAYVVEKVGIANDYTDGLDVIVSAISSWKRRVLVS